MKTSQKSAVSKIATSADYPGLTIETTAHESWPDQRYWVRHGGYTVKRFAKLRDARRFAKLLARFRDFTRDDVVTYDLERIGDLHACGICSAVVSEGDSTSALFVGRICDACESQFVRVKLPKLVSPAEHAHRRQYARFLRGKAYPQLTVVHTNACGAIQGGPIAKRSDFFQEVSK